MFIFVIVEIKKAYLTGKPLKISFTSDTIIPAYLGLGKKR